MFGRLLGGEQTFSLKMAWQKKTPENAGLATRDLSVLSLVV